MKITTNGNAKIYVLLNLQPFKEKLSQKACIVTQKAQPSQVFNTSVAVLFL